MQLPGSCILILALAGAGPDRSDSAFPRQDRLPLTKRLEKIADPRLRSNVANEASAMRGAEIRQAQFAQPLEREPDDGGPELAESTMLPDDSARVEIQPTMRPSNQADQPIKLAPPAPTHGSRPGKIKPPTSAGALVTVFSSLAIVLGLFFLVVWITRRTGGQRRQMLTKDVVEVMGSTPLTSRQQLQLIRVANKMLLVAVTPESSETLTEITDPDEIVRIRALCQKTTSAKSGESFGEILSTLRT